jgi:PEP-CTERM motif-containing protein
MKTRRHLFNGTAVRLLFLTACTVVTLNAGTIAYGINLIGQFETIDLGTGVVTPIGPGTPNGLDGIGGAPGGPFYGVDPVTGHLIRINASGAVTDIGDTGTGANAGPNGISISSSLLNGNLYALDFSSNLLSLNPLTGAATLAGNVSGLAPSEQVYQGNLFTSFSGNATDLFYTLEIPTGPLQIAPTLYDIEPLTHTATAKPLIGISDVIGSGWIQGTLYGFTGDGNIATINTDTGMATIVAHYDAGQIPDGPPLTGIFGAVDTPEPASFWLAGLALAGIAIVRRIYPVPSSRG